MRVDEELIAKGVRLILQGINANIRDPNYRNTPARVAKLYRELLSPQVSNWATFPVTSANMVILRGHRVVALCPHHLQVVELRCHVGYLPHRRTVGLSKLARVVEAQLDQPILQEELTNSVASALDEKLEPKGVGVVLAGQHGCMRYRGVETQGDVVTSAMRGELLLNPATRAEFMQLVGTP